MPLLSLPTALSSANPRAVAAVSGLISWLYLHKVSLRGDVVLILLAVAANVLYVLHHNLTGARSWASIIFAASMLIDHIATIIIATVTYRLSPFHPLAQFPGPLINKITSLKVAHMVFTGKRYSVIIGLHEKYGKFVRTGPNTLSINSHAAVGPLYSSAAAFSKSNAYIPGKMHGEGLFFIRSRDEHNVRRRVWAPAFAAPVVEGWKPILEERTKQLMDCMAARRDADGTIDFSLVLQHWAWDVMGSLTFGDSTRLELMKDRDPGRYVESGQVATVAFEVLGEVPWLFDLVWYLPITKVIRVLDNLADSLINIRAKKTFAKDDDIAGWLLGEHDSKAPRLSQDDLRIDALFAIQAGSDTTSGVLNFMFYYLLSDENTYNRLRAELDEAFPYPDDDFNLERLTALPYLSAVVDESLRLGTPFPGLPRVVPKEGAMIDGKFVPGDTVVGIPPHAQHTSPENFWPEPWAFKPERWLPGGLGPGSRARKAAIMSFSYGSFGCLGKPLALQELRIVAARMLLTYDLKFAPGFDRKAFMDGMDNMRTTIFRYHLKVVATRR